MQDVKYVDSFSVGSGTPEDPYLIHDVYELQAMKNNVYAHYALAQDIDASETVNWNNGAGFEPIGTFIDMFGGSFDGRGYKITGLHINRENTDYVGLFGYADSATIQNVGLVDGTIVGGSYVGGIVGHLSGTSATVRKCYNAGSVRGEYYTGGVVGFVSDCSVTECYNTGSVTGVSDTGGVVGLVSSGSATECYNTGNVTGVSETGGVVGLASDCSVTQCYNRGSVIGESYTGSVVGLVSYSSVTECYNRGSVTGESYTGSVIGLVYGGYVAQCYNRGSVTGVSDTGGVAGLISDCFVTQCYNTGSVTGEGNTGGVVGYLDTSAPTTISSCYWNTETSGVSTGVGSGPEDGVSGKTTVEMMQQATYVDWDFDDVWFIDEGNDYPRFQWESPPGPIEKELRAPGIVMVLRVVGLVAPGIVQADVNIDRVAPGVVRGGIETVLDAPVQMEVRIRRRARAPFVVNPKVRRIRRWPLEIEALFWRRVPKPPGVFGGE